MVKRRRAEAVVDAEGGDGDAGSQAPPVGAPALLAAPGPDDVTLLIGGDTFIFPRRILTSKPQTMLGTMFSESNRALWEGKGPYRFDDRDSDVFQCVAEFYRSGELAPPDVKVATMLELDF
jgi:hypothetical protein